ncbi:MAG: DUF4395 domain-containing protein [Acidimicrobiia bacterium]
MPTPEPAPLPIDARGPRFAQGVVALVLFAGFVFHASWVIPVALLLVGAGAALGPSASPLVHLHRSVVAPRLGPARDLDDPRRARFAALVGSVLLGLGTALWLMGEDGMAWLFALTAAGLAALDAATGICLGCEIYARARHRRGDGPAT